MSPLSHPLGGMKAEPQEKGPLSAHHLPPRLPGSRVGSNPATVAALCLHSDKCPSTTSHSKKFKLSPPGRHDGKTTETFSFQLLFAWSCKANLL